MVPLPAFALLCIAVAIVAVAGIACSLRLSKLEKKTEKELGRLATAIGLLADEVYETDPCAPESTSAAVKRAYPNSPAIPADCSDFETARDPFNCDEPTGSA